MSLKVTSIYEKPAEAGLNYFGLQGIVAPEIMLLERRSRR